MADHKGADHHKQAAEHHQQRPTTLTWRMVTAFTPRTIRRKPQNITPTSTVRKFQRPTCR